jgi:hypothetical protein
MFDKSLYLKEMKELIDKAIERLHNEMPSFKIYTTSIWTDPNAAVSSINFDSKNNSLKKVEKSNEWSKKYYDQYLADGDLEQAELFKPNEGMRICNPADFELRDFEEISHDSFLQNWESDTDGECWKELEPALIEIGNYAFIKHKNLNLEEGFELSVNSERDWYDKTWR